MDLPKHQVFVNTKPKWSWRKFQSVLKTKIGSRACMVDLKPQMVFQISEQTTNARKLQVIMTIDTQRSPNYCQENGWNWHKSRKFPSISLKIDLQNPQNQMKYCLPTNAQAHLFAVKIVGNSLEQNNKFYLEDVGVIGDSRVQIKNGQAIFDGIRFQTTSYINEGVKLYLLIVVTVSQQSESDQKNENKLGDVICSIISSSMFIDSRKFARQYHQKKLISFVKVFQPKTFSKNFHINRIGCQPNRFEQLKIQNSMEGLLNYLTATNIRNKIKHPLFLSIKFSNVFKVLYNCEHRILKKDLSLRSVLLQFQRILISEIYPRGKGYLSKQKQRKQVTAANYNSISQKLFLISIVGYCSSHMKNKLYQSFNALNCRSIQLARYGYQIKPFFHNIQQLGNIVKTYKMIHQELNKMEQSFQYFENDIEEEDMENQQLIRSEQSQNYDQNQESNLKTNSKINRIEYKTKSRQSKNRWISRNAITSGPQLNKIASQHQDEIYSQENEEFEAHADDCKRQQQPQDKGVSCALNKKNIQMQIQYKTDEIKNNISELNQNWENILKHNPHRCDTKKDKQNYRNELRQGKEYLQLSEEQYKKQYSRAQMYTSRLHKTRHQLSWIQKAKQIQSEYKEKHQIVESIIRDYEQKQTNVKKQNQMQDVQPFRYQHQFQQSYSHNLRNLKTYSQTIKDQLVNQIDYQNQLMMMIVLQNIKIRLNLTRASQNYQNFGTIQSGILNRNRHYGMLRKRNIKNKRIQMENEVKREGSEQIRMGEQSGHQQEQEQINNPRYLNTTTVNLNEGTPKYSHKVENYKQNQYDFNRHLMKINRVSQIQPSQLHRLYSITNNQN